MRVKDVMTTRVVAVGKDPDRFEVAVSSGVVTLGGHPETATRGRDIMAETWHVEGVVAVRDRLAYPEGK